MPTKWQWVPGRRLYKRLTDMDAAQTIGMAEAADVLNEIVPLRKQLEAAQAEVAAVRQRAKEGLERKQGELEELRRLFRAYIDMRDSNSMSWAFMAEVQEALKEGE